MKLQRLSDLFWRVSPNLFFFSMVLGVVTGLCYALLIPFLMSIIGGGNINFELLHEQGTGFFDSPTFALGRLFVTACVLIIVVKTLSSFVSLYIATQASVEHRLSLYRKIGQLSYADLERFGQSKLINLLKIDVPKITSAALGYPTLWTSSVTVLGLLGYLAFLDVRVFAIVAGCALFGIVIYQLPMLLSVGALHQARSDEEEIHEGLKGLILGAKELKLNRKKSDSFYDIDLQQPEQHARRAKLKGTTFLLFAENFIGVFSFLIIALVVFHLPYVFELNHSELLGIILALVYLTGPLGEMMAAYKRINEGCVSLSRLQQFHQEMTAEPLDNSVKIDQHWQQFEVKNLTYQYDKAYGGFALQPLNLTFKRGEITFIIGGNGCGKSTLSKCLTLHYPAKSGALYFDDQVVDKHSLESARQQLSAIYGDFHLFSRVFGNDQKDLQRIITEYLIYLELEDKVTIKDGRFCTKALSTGQKKRLSLLALLLEDRNIGVFDEWASDQDPRFKKLFYTKILPDLKAQNKVVIVISHDDRYFDCADQVVVMEAGAAKEVISRPITRNRMGMAQRQDGELV